MRMDHSFDDVSSLDLDSARKFISGGGARRGLVLDIETVPDLSAVTLSGRNRAAPKGSPLNEVVNVSALSFLEFEDGSFGQYHLHSWHRESANEESILRSVDNALGEVAEDGGILATFNGKSFDLPVLQNRMLRWWLCDARSIARIGAGAVRHIDVMLELSASGQARWPSLSDACASLGFCLDPPVTLGRQSILPKETQKCERDVVGTAILLHYVLALHRHSRQPLEDGLPELGRFLKPLAKSRPHLARFAQSELLSAAAKPWGKSR